MQEYQAKYEEQKRVYKDKVDEFLAGLGGKEEQDAYLNSLAEYKAKRRAYPSQALQAKEAWLSQGMVCLNALLM
jgi:hypothetical protein